MDEATAGLTGHDTARPGEEPVEEPAILLPLERRVEEMLRRKEAGDHIGALVLADSVVRERPEHGLARVCLQESLDVVRFGELSGVPIPLIASSQVARLALHPKSAFLLSRVDGTRSIDKIIELGGLPRAQGLRLLAEFVRRRLIYFLPA